MFPYIEKKEKIQKPSRHPPETLQPCMSAPIPIHMWNGFIVIIKIIVE